MAILGGQLVVEALKPPEAEGIARNARLRCKR
jgi:hypothetical protein